MQSEVAYGGSFGGEYRLRLTVTQLQSDTYNNRTLCRLQADMRKVTGYNWTYNYNDTSGSLTYDGTTVGRIMDYYDFRNGNNGPFYFTESYTDVWINHNADGTKTANFQAYHNAANSPYLTTASVSFNYTLNTINRNATINLFTASPITDTSFTINVGTDVTCDLFEISTDNGSTWMTAFAGDFTSKSYQFNNQPSDTTWQVKVRVRRKDSQIKTTSTALAVTTLSQNNFMGFL